MLRYLPGVRAGLAPEFAAALERTLGPLAGDFVGTEGHRDPARADALHAAWVRDPLHAPRAVGASDSAHCAIPARALDVTLIGLTGAVWDYTDRRWRALVLAVDASPDLHSLDHLGDTDHVEQTAWRAHARADAFTPIQAT